MSRKRYPIDQIITKLREAEVRISRGETVAQACKAIEVTEQTYYRWRKQYNEVHPHSSLGYQPPAPEAWEVAAVGKPSASLRSSPRHSLSACDSHRTWYKDWGLVSVEGELNA